MSVIQHQPSSNQTQYIYHHQPAIYLNASGGKSGGPKTSRDGGGGGGNGNNVGKSSRRNSGIVHGGPGTGGGVTSSSTPSMMTVMSSGGAMVNVCVGHQDDQGMVYSGTPGSGKGGMRQSSNTGRKENVPAVGQQQSVVATASAAGQGNALLMIANPLKSVQSQRKNTKRKKLGNSDNGSDGGSGDGVNVNQQQQPSSSVQQQHHHHHQQSGGNSNTNKEFGVNR